MGSLNIEGMSQLFVAKKFYIYAVLTVMCISFVSQATMYIYAQAAELSDRSARMLYGYEAIERAVLFGVLAY